MFISCLLHIMEQLDLHIFMEQLILIGSHFVVSSSYHVTINSHRFSFLVVSCCSLCVCLLFRSQFERSRCVWVCHYTYEGGSLCFFLYCINNYRQKRGNRALSVWWFWLSHWEISSILDSVGDLSVDRVVGYVIIPKSPNMILF